MDDQLHGLVQDVEGDYLHRLAFVLPPRMSWPLPVYELALMTAQRAYEMDIELSVFIVSPESMPLEIFGSVASDAVASMLRQRGVEFVASRCEVTHQGVISLRPGPETLRVDRIVALPEPFGPSTPGVPGGARGGFIPIDAYGRVKRLDAVFAAGDATDFPVKLGGIAAQQADVAAASIAALAGCDVELSPFDPEIEGILLGGDTPLRLMARLAGGRPTSSSVDVASAEPGGAKIAARYLGLYLTGVGRHEVRSSVVSCSGSAVGQR